MSTDEFTLTVDLSRTNFALGEKIIFTATITNQSGKDVNIATNGEMPCSFFHLTSDTTTHAEISQLVTQSLKANETMSKTYEYTPMEAGTYILDIHYKIKVNNILLEKKLDDILIEVK